MYRAFQRAAADFLGVIFKPRWVVSDTGEVAFGRLAVLIATIAVALRFWNLGGASIWMDEAVSLALARLPIETILFANIDNHPPLSFLVQHYWHTLVPDVGFARVPSAIFGGLTVLALMALLHDQVSRRASLVGGALFGFSTVHIYYSQDLRMYALLALGLVLAAWGAIGLARPKNRSLLTYSILYILGAIIAIYAHAIALICLALIGGAGLVGSYLSRRKWHAVLRWLICTSIVAIFAVPWLTQLPYLASSFHGLGDSVPVLDAQWFYRNAVGYPGLSAFGTVMDVLVILAAGISILVAIWHKHWALAMLMAGLVIIYPLMLTGIHLHRSILSTRTMIPATIGVSLALAFGLSQIRHNWLRYLAITLFVGAAAASSLSELSTRTKLENNRAALKFTDANGFAGAPILTCHTFTATALWEEAPGRTIYYVEDGPLLHYKNPNYWRAASNSVTVMRTMSQSDIDTYLGGGWIVAGGLPAVLAAEPDLAVIRSRCPATGLAYLEASLATANYQPAAELDMRLAPGEDVMIAAPETIVTLYRRGN